MQKVVKKIDHIGIAVKSIETALSFYTNTLKLPLLAIEDVESEGVKVAFLQVGESKIELLEPLNDASPVAKFIASKGEGIHHVALAVDSIEARLTEIKENGIKMIHETPKQGAGGAKIAFIHPKATMGTLYELCEKQGKGEEK